MGHEVAESKSVVSSKAIAIAVGVFGPFLQSIITQAESTGATGEQKHRAVAAAAKALWIQLGESGVVKELKGIPWEVVEPILIGNGQQGGLITIIVSLFNALLGKIWGAFGGSK